MGKRGYYRQNLDRDRNFYNRGIVSGQLTPEQYAVYAGHYGNRIIKMCNESIKNNGQKTSTTRT